MSNNPKTSKPYPAQEWRMPPLATIFLCDDGCERTLGEMIAGYGDGFVPKDDDDMLMVLERYGCDWTSPIVNYSFMQRDEALAALNDSDRYRELSERCAQIPDMRWIYDAIANTTIGEFVEKHLPEAHDWINSTYRVTSLDSNKGTAFRVNTEIPTSGQECWVSFEITVPDPDDEPTVLFFRAIRSGVGADEEKIYTCRSADSEWEEVKPEDD